MVGKYDASHFCSLGAEFGKTEVSQPGGNCKNYEGTSFYLSGTLMDTPPARALQPRLTYFSHPQGNSCY